jgi:hypothetical protein
VEERRESAGVAPDGTREWLLQLERRVTELEQAAERTQRARKRARMFILAGVALYVLLLYWEMTQLF